MAPSERCGEADLVIATELTDVEPAHYVLKIKSFSLFAQNNMEKYESSEFEAGGHQWKLILYPNGDENRNGKDHISIYLAVSGTIPVQLSGAVHAAVRFSLYDQIRNRYLTKQGRVTKFHLLKTEWGVPKYMPLETFNNPSEGYLVDDTCVFGVEVFVIKSSGVGKCLTLRSASDMYTHKWKIARLSSLENESYSDVFTVGDHKWKVLLYPRGNSTKRDQSLSVFLVLADADQLASDQTVNTRFAFRLTNRTDTRDPHKSETCTVRMSSSVTNWGWPAFMPLTMVKERLADDPCLLEAEVTVLGTESKLT